MIFAGARSHAAPGQGRGAAQLGSHRGRVGVQEQEQGVGAEIGVKDSRLNQRREQGPGKFSFLHQVMLDPWPVLGHRRWKRPRRRCEYRGGRGGKGVGKALFQPLECLAKAHLPEVHDQIDGAASADALIPVHELGPGHRQDPLIGAPLGRVVENGRGPQVFQDHGQGQGAKPVGSCAPVHGSADILVRKVTHSFMLKRWLDSVSRSIKAAVR